MQHGLLAKIIVTYVLDQTNFFTLQMIPDPCILPLTNTEGRGILTDFIRGCSTGGPDPLPFHILNFENQYPFTY